MRKIAIILFIFISSFSFSQTYTMSNTTINTCGGTFFDSGGAGADYSNSENITMTFCSDQSGSEISFDFTTFDLENSWDEIQIYDGTGTSGTQLVVDGSGTTLQGEVIESIGSGCLTFVFTSDGSVGHAGWEANISCTFPCQDFTADFTNVSEPYYNSDTIRLCQNTPLTMTIGGNFPNNGTNYNQDDASSTFYWNFGDGTDTSGIGLSTITHDFEEGGAVVIVDVYDNNNCSNSNTARIVVMTSTTPTFTGTSITDTICPGETISFNGNINIVPWEQEIPEITGIDAFIDDVQGQEFTSTITNNFFPTGSTVNNLSDISSICLNMEHSYMGDLEIWITCPTGQSMHLIENPNNGGGTFLGEPIALDLPVDANTTNLTPGIGYEYCFSSSATNGQIDDSNNWTALANYTDSIGQTSSGTLNQLPEGTYEAEGLWTDLVGCPLNGDWTLHFEDHMGSDNGYVFSWIINWDTTLTTNLWTYVNTYDPAIYSWSGQGITNQTNGSGNAIPTVNGGDEIYTFTATDDFGCSYDTTVSVYVHPTNHPGCCITPLPNAGTNDSICGLSIQLNASFFDTNNNGLWTVLGPGNISFDDATSNTTNVTADTYGIYTFIWTEYNPAGCQASDTITISFNQNPDITVNTTNNICFENTDGSASVIHNTNTGDPYVYLWSNTETTQNISNMSNGTYSVIVSNIHACTSTETVTITGPTEGLATSISSANILCNGDNTGDVAITVNGGTTPYNYLWNNGVSTNNNPNIAAGWHIVTVTDNNNCIVKDSIEITEPAALSYTLQSTSLLCAGSNNGNIEIDINGGVPNYNYLWSNGKTDTDLYNIPGGIYSVTVTDMNGCSIVASNIELTEPAPVKASIFPNISTICLNSDQDLSCSVNGGQPPYTYAWNNASTTNNINVSPIDTTEYFILVTDANGCISDTTFAIVNVLPPITATAIGDKIEICPGDPLNIIVNAQGGNGNYNYSIQTGEIVSDNFIVYPNQTMVYIITVSDNCNSPEGTAQVNISVLESPPVSFIPDIHYGCQPLTVHFSEQSIDEGQTYEWNFGDNSSSNIGSNKNPVHVYENYGLFDVSLTVTSIDGCKASSHISGLIDVYKLPEAKFIANPTTVSVIKPEVVFNNQSTDANISYWSFGDGDSTIANNTVHTYADFPNDYTISLVVESNKGCRDTTYSSIKVNEVTTIYVPTAFTPDNDGINDFFVAKGSGIELDYFIMQIYNRWGEIIFESDDMYVGWDGKLKSGKFATSGVYYWSITYKDFSGVEYKKSGNVSLVR